MQYMVDEPRHCRVIMSQLPMGMYVYFELCVSNAGSFKRSITDVDFINFLKYA